MTRLFGTDGIRGVANEDLPPKLAFDLGRATAAHLVGKGGGLLLGQDTRRSGDMLVAAVAAGAMSLGADVYRLGVCPTPALAHLTAAGDYGAGIMVSASHNPARDNGLKVVDEKGLKLDDPVEEKLEALIFRADELMGPTTPVSGARSMPGPRSRSTSRTGWKSRNAGLATARSSSTAPTARPARWRSASWPRPARSRGPLQRA